MATTVFTNPHFLFGGTNLGTGDHDLSTYCRELTINYEADTPEDTTVATTGTAVTSKTYSLGGLRDWSIDATLIWDAANVEAHLYAHLGVRSSCFIHLNDTDIGTANPLYAGLGILQSYAPVAGAMGDQLLLKIHIVAAGPMARTTA